MNNIKVDAITPNNMPTIEILIILNGELFVFEIYLVLVSSSNFKIFGS